MTPASSFPISRVVRHDSLLVRLDALLPYPRNYWQLQEVSINSMILVGTGDIHDRATDGPSETVPGIATMAVLLVSWSVYPSIANQSYFVYLTTVLM